MIVIVSNKERMLEMNNNGIIKLAVIFLAVAPMVALSVDADSSLKSSNGEVVKAYKRKPSAFKKEFMEWAAKQDWFALSAKAEFGDFNREKLAEKGMTFGYSTEFVDSKGKKHILGVGLAKDPAQEVKREMKKNMADMSAKKNLMMYGKPVSTDASGKQSRSFSGTVNATQVLSTTIVKPGTEEKWILCVCAKIRGGKKTTSAPKRKDQ